MPPQQGRKLTRTLHALAALLLAANLGAALYVVAGTARGAPRWVAAHYAAARPANCEATVARLRAAIRQARHAEPSAEDEARLARLRASGRCEDGAAEVLDIERTLAPP
jgi:hypothetical protein